MQLTPRARERLSFRRAPAGTAELVFENPVPGDAILPRDGVRVRGWYLTPREIDVLRLLAAGHGTDEVAVSLGLSENTVRSHIQHLLHKLDAHSQLQAVALARRNHLI